MKSLSKQRHFRAFVPLILNQRVVQWYFEDGEPTIVLDIPMRHYERGDRSRWDVQHVRIVFHRMNRNHQAYYRTKKDSSMEFTCELYYTCNNSRVTFEEGVVPLIS